MDVGRKAILAIATTAVLALGVAACGGSSNDNSDNASAATGSGSTGGGTVSTKSVSGVGDVLVDSKGAALYTNDMDTASKVACTDQCLTEWVPLAAQGTPSSSDAAVQPKLGTMKRPDGGSQVTYKGMPLYTFVEDSNGQVTGNGFTDSFGGTTFTWTAATAGASAGSSTGTTSSSSGGTGYGGGGY